MTYSREREALDTLIGFMEGTAIGIRIAGKDLDIERSAKGLEEKAAWAREHIRPLPNLAKWFANQEVAER